MHIHAKLDALDTPAILHLLDVVDTVIAGAPCQEMIHRFLSTRSFQVGQVRTMLCTSTLNSRFVKAGLPTPFRYMRWARLVRFRALLADPTVTVLEAASLLGWETRAAAHREVRTLCGVTVMQFRYHGSVASLIAAGMAQLVVPHGEILRTFDPERPVRQAPRSLQRLAS